MSATSFPISMDGSQEQVLIRSKPIIGSLVIRAAIVIETSIAAIIHWRKTSGSLRAQLQWPVGLSNYHTILDVLLPISKLEKIVYTNNGFAISYYINTQQAAVVRLYDCHLDTRHH